MTIVGGFDVHRKQLTFDYVDTETGEVRWGQIRPATRKTLRSWLAEHCPNGDGEFALEGCTAWRYVAEELTAVGAVAHLADPAEAAGYGDRRNGPKATAPMPGCCAHCYGRAGYRSRRSHRRMCWRCARWHGCTAR